MFAKFIVFSLLFFVQAFVVVGRQDENADKILTSIQKHLQKILLKEDDLSEMVKQLKDTSVAQVRTQNFILFS